MRVTLMTDASVCADTGAAGYGFWCVSARGSMAGGNPFKAIIKDSYEGEFKAVVNALHECLNQKLILEGDEVLIQLDNAGVVRNLTSIEPKRKDIKEAKLVLDQMVITFKLKLRSRHVKGHSNKVGNRYTANKCCDMRAKLSMKQARLNHAVHLRESTH